jgi:hypothetical protein
MKAISTLTADNNLKMSFKFPRYGRDLKFKATKSEDYSVRNIAKNIGNLINLDKNFT